MDGRPVRAPYGLLVVPLNWLLHQRARPLSGHTQANDYLGYVAVPVEDARMVKGFRFQNDKCSWMMDLAMAVRGGYPCLLLASKRSHA